MPRILLVEPHDATRAALGEILGIADRIIVMCDGRVTGEFPAGTATQEKILECATRFEDKLGLAAGD